MDEGEIHKAFPLLKNHSGQCLLREGDADFSRIVLSQAVSPKDVYIQTELIRLVRVCI